MLPRRRGFFATIEIVKIGKFTACGHTGLPQVGISFPVEATQINAFRIVGLHFPVALEAIQSLHPFNNPASWRFVFAKSDVATVVVKDANVRGPAMRKLNLPGIRTTLGKSKPAPFEKLGPDALRFCLIR